MKFRHITLIFIVACISLISCTPVKNAEAPPNTANANKQAPPPQPEQPPPTVAPATPVAVDAGTAPPPSSAGGSPQSTVKVAEVIKSASTPANSPKITLASTKLDFGKQGQNQTISRSITVRNSGKSDLAIESVTPSCGCTTVDFPKLIHAGKIGRIEIKVETGTSPGPHTKQVTIKSNDPDQPTVIVQFSFDVKG